MEHIPHSTGFADTGQKSGIENQRVGVLLPKCGVSDKIIHRRSRELHKEIREMTRRCEESIKAVTA